MTAYIKRAITPQIEKAHNYYPVITVTGPRQSGKSTLCRHLFPDYRYVNFENIATRAQASRDPEGFLAALGDHAVIDEVQHVPEIMSEIQVRVDDDRKRRYILTGSSNFSLLNHVSQSLAGRTALFTLFPFDFTEMPEEMRSSATDTLMFRGFYPGVLFDGIDADMFYVNYYNTYVERDLRDLLKVSNLAKFDMFVRMLALRVGSEFNASAMSREVGVSATTITEWLSLLATSYIIFELPPYYSNPGKSLTKNKKIYFSDTGLLCSLLSIENPDMLSRHPLRGQIFENMAVSAMVKQQANAGRRVNLYFYRENRGIEVDVVQPAGDGSLRLYEIKGGRTLRPDYSDNMKKLSESLTVVTSSTVVYDGESYPPASLNVRDL